jgi:hypothetical protein
MVLVAGVPIPAEDIERLIRLLRDETGFDEPAGLLERHLNRGAVIVGLSISDRERLLIALQDPPGGPLAELRGILLEEHRGRVRDGLV